MCQSARCQVTSTGRAGIDGDEQFVSTASLVSGKRMPTSSARFDADAVRQEWNTAADAYAEAQATGRDYYRLEFFGPAQVELCGDVRGLRILDVGCGAGYFSREMARGGAKVSGVDLSPKMLAHARELEANEPLGIQFRELDASRLLESFGAGSFEMATSCMALHDMPQIPAVLNAIHGVLVDGGRLVASIAHPCTDTPSREWAKHESGAKKALCIDRYFERGPVTYQWKDWKYEFSTSAYHATLEDWFGWFTDAGFSVRALREPRPSPAALKAHPDLEDAARVPHYLMFDVERNHDDD